MTQATTKTKIANTPKTRFPEFQGGWVSHKLGDIAEFFKGKNISKEDVIEGGKIEVIRYGELYTRYSEVIDKVFSRSNLDPGTLFLSKINDVIIPASGETNIDIATASCVTKSGVGLSGDINVIRTQNDGVFLSYYLNNKRRLDIARMAQGNSVVHLYPSQLASLILNLPTLEEQRKIAVFLAAVDDKIAALQQKNDLLKKYKKGAARAIFTQKLRFKDENDNDYPDWEEKPLVEISERVTKKNKDNGSSAVLTNSAVQGIVNQGEFFDKNIANPNNLTNYTLVSTGDFVYNPRISAMAPVGPIRRNHLGAGVMSPLYTVFRIKQGNLDFYESYFATYLWHDYLRSVANSGARHDRMNITTYEFYQMPVPLPREEEQQKIADFLTALDDKVNLTEKELEQAKKFKKSLLQQMFV